MRLEVKQAQCAQLEQKKSYFNGLCILDYWAKGSAWSHQVREVKVENLVPANSFFPEDLLFYLFGVNALNKK